MHSNFSSLRKVCEIEIKSQKMVKNASDNALTVKMKGAEVRISNHASTSRKVPLLNEINHFAVNVKLSAQMIF